MSALLVIGGTGFFGKSILDAFSLGLLKPWGISKVIVMSRNAESLLKSAPELIGDNVELYSADISTSDFLPYADYVIHAAASTDIRDYLSGPDERKNNIEAGTLNYCHLARKYHLNSKIVYVSSGAVYGVQPPELEGVTEDSALTSVLGMDAGKLEYAQGKLAAENAIKQLANDGLSVSVARCFAFVGRWLPRDQHFAIGNFIEDALQGRDIVVKARHQVYRSYMYADDLVEWLMTIAEHASTRCPVYNVGADQPILMGDLAKLVAKLTNTNADVPLITDDRIDRYIPSIIKAHQELKLKLKYDLEQAINHTIFRINHG